MGGAAEVHRVSRCPFEQVVGSHLRKYPSPLEKHIMAVETVEEKTDLSTGIIYQRRIEMCQNVIPGILRKEKVSLRRVSSLEPHICIAIGIPWLLSELYWYPFIEERASNMHSWKKRRPQTADLLQKLKESYCLRERRSRKSRRNKRGLGASTFLGTGAVISGD
ncbi:LOW QUALITY PROTEIN: PRELI domain-containing protein 2 [Opisthocomus hoazin]|uniref:LOW QUALITY PROTEIN: PRELI domain-containing protein 2 n=1 Tax=Opisthocomus hoazin TaxID=30419 RepID=UPI003F537B06